MAAFTDEEEQLFSTADGARWLLVGRMREKGAKHVSGPAHQVFTTRDRNLFTGQNPASSAPMAEAMVAALASPRARPAIRRAVWEALRL